MGNPIAATVLIRPFYLDLQIFPMNSPYLLPPYVPPRVLPPFSL